ncbi:MAG: U32 family peptidase [Eubacteriales bacterium]
MKKKIELLSPVGDWERLEVAIAYGADAVYLAGNLFGMRSFSGNFGEGVLDKAVAYAHERGVKVYVTCNTMPRNEEVALLPSWLEYLAEVGVDAVILADVGVLALAKRHAPSVDIHISTQASIVNYAAANMYHDLGAKRVILARELSLAEIIDLKANVSPELELEAFVHGSMCMSYSGRCLISSFMTGRDANRGACAQPCRYQYGLVEERREGEVFSIVEEAGETFLLNSRDLSMIDHVEELTQVGIDSLKIEGRAKSAYYAAVITGAYRQALDAVARGEALDPVWRNEVYNVSHREYSTGFFYGEPGQYVKSSGYFCDWKVVAIVTACEENGRATLTLRNKFAKGEEVDIVGPDVKPFSMIVGDLWEESGEILEEVRHPEMVFYLNLPQKVPAYSMVRRKIENPEK